MPAAAKPSKAPKPRSARAAAPSEVPALGAMLSADAKVVKAARRDLEKVAIDLWWSWNEVAQRPFAALDPIVWEAKIGRAHV